MRKTTPLTSYKDYENEIDKTYGVLGSHDYFQGIKATALQRMIEQLTPRGESLKILDVGAGTGTLLRALSGQHLRIGIEPDLEMISQIPSGSKDYAIVSASGLELPFPDASFDIVYMASVLHHVERKKIVPLLTECARTLRDGGILVIFEHNAYNLPVVLFLKAFVRIDRDAHFLTPRTLRKLVEQTELRPRETVYMCFFPGFLRFLFWLEKHIFWLPFGGQYCFAAFKPGAKENEIAIQPV